MATTGELTALLHEILRDRARRRELIGRFQQAVWDSPADGEIDEIEDGAGEVFADLAHDLDYYEPDPEARHEDPSFYGDERLEEEVRAALAKLGG